MSNSINRMFSDIHERYDLMNHLLSLGVDVIWRDKTANETIIGKNRYRVLDLATGTGDLAIAINDISARNDKHVDITGVDFNKDMLNVARKKAGRRGLKINFEVGDVLALRFKNRSFDVITCSFAMRDFDNLSKFLKECYRVLKKDGKVILVDMSKPEKGIMRHLFNIYMNVMLLEGMLVNRSAYAFLVKSIREFDKKNLLRLMKIQGFKTIRLAELPSGAAFLVSAGK